MTTIARVFCTSALVLASWAQAGDKFQDWVPAEAVAGFDQARRLEKDGKAGAAEDRLREVTKAEPRYYNATYRLGILLANQGKLPESTQVLEKARTIKESEKIKDATIYNSLGWAYFLAGDTANAEKAFLQGKANEASLSQESKARLYNNLGHLYLTIGEFEKARSTLSYSQKAFGSTFAEESLRTVDKLQQADRDRAAKR